MTHPPTSSGAVIHRRAITAPDGATLSLLLAEPPPSQPVAPGLPPILAVHGFASSASQGWGRTGHLDTLTRAGRVVVAPDLRGHGESDKPHRSPDYALPVILDDLVAAAGECRHSRGEAAMGEFDLLGYSLGARLCWEIACGGVLPVRRAVLGGFDGRPLFAGVDAARLDALAASVPGNDRVALRHLVEGLTGSRSDGGDGTPAQAPPPGSAPQATAPGPLSDIPALLVAGERDPIAARAEEFAAALPHGKYLLVPGRDHISTVPSQRFRRAAAEFLAEGAAADAAGPTG